MSTQDPKAPISYQEKIAHLDLKLNTQIISRKKSLKKTAILPLATTVLLDDPYLPAFILPDHEDADSGYNVEYNQEEFEGIEALKDALKLLTNFKFNYLDNHKKLLEQLVKNPPAFVFNLCEGFKNHAELEPNVPALLEMLDIPYTGASPTCLMLTYNKSLTRMIAKDLNIPVPEETYYVLSKHHQPSPTHFPVIIKPNNADGSFGITQNAVVNNQQELNQYLMGLNEQFLSIPLLIQQFLPGQEYSLGLIGNPGNFEFSVIYEIDYSQLPEHLPKILCYDYKWKPESPYRQLVKITPVTSLSEYAQKIMLEYSQLLFERLDCRDYARFDFRADSEGNLKLLEVNANPSGLGDLAWIASISYESILEKILNAAKKRLKL